MLRRHDHRWVELSDNSRYCRVCGRAQVYARGRWARTLVLAPRMLAAYNWWFVELGAPFMNITVGEIVTLYEKRIKR